MMRRTIFWFISLTLSFCFSSVHAAPAADFATTVNNLIQKNIPNAQIGIVILDGQTGKTLYSYNADRPFTPASTAKILPAAASLFILGPDYHYQTTVSLNPAQKQDQTLNSNLYIKFTGDPSLTIQDLRQLIQQTKQYGITTIKGDVILDSSRFVEPYYAPGWTQDSLTWHYSAPISAITLNENALPLQITPGPKIGDKVSIKQADGRSYIDINSNVTTTTYLDALRCPLVPHLEGSNQLTVTGCWPIKQPSGLSIAINHPEAYAQRVVAQALRDYGITLQGKVKSGVMDPQTTLIATKSSEPLSTLLKHLLKKSDNLYTENLIKTLGSASGNRGSFRNGVIAMKSILNQKFRINFSNTELWDGSGQSRYNLVTPMHLAQVLYGMYHTPELSDVFQQALSIAGADGTLRYRLGTKELAGRIHAKTGSLKGISALTGYVYSRNGHPYVFAIMVNQIVGKNQNAKQVQNEICRLLAENRV